MADETSTSTLLSAAQKEELVAALKKKGVPRSCPMCGTNNWTIGDGYFYDTLQRDFRAVNLGGVGIPSIPIICSNCGFISQHALGALGLLPRSTEQTENSK